MVGVLEWLAYVQFLLKPLLQESNVVVSYQRLPTSSFHSGGVIPSHPLPQFVVLSLSDLHTFTDLPLRYILPDHVLELTPLVAAMFFLC